VHQVEPGLLAAEGPAAPWARVGRVVGGDELGAQPVVLSVVPAGLAAATGAVTLPGAVRASAGAADVAAAAEAWAR
jgi:hypothetical protein